MSRDGILSLSLNEVESLGKTACRGMGYPWGLADEGGKALRWLAQQGLAEEAASALSRLGQTVSQRGVMPMTPIPGETWHAPGEALCPLMAGASCVDFGLEGDTPRQLGCVIGPLLLVPFVGWLAGLLGRPLAMSWPGGTARTDGFALELGDLPPDPVDEISIAGTIGHLVSRARSTRAVLGQDTHAALLDFAKRTYAPATEESRRKGAGAAGTDND